MRPRIAIDARMFGFTGIGTYLKGLLQNFAALQPEFQFELIYRDASLVEMLPADMFTFIPARARIYSAGEHWEVARLARGADLLHCPHYNAPFLYRGRLVVTIHDLTHLNYPPSRAAWLYARWSLASACRRARAVITVSEHSRQDIEQRLHVAPNKVRVIYQGLPECSPPTEPQAGAGLAQLGVESPYILFVGLLKPHKNVEGLIRAYAGLSASVSARHQLVIAGKKDQSYPELERLTRQLSLRDRIVFTGHVSDASLRMLYSRASLFVLPSLSEGFGLPALEAMAHGVPVVASSRSSLPEVVGDAGVLVDPVRPAELAAAMERVLLDVGLHESLARKGRMRVKEFSSKESALKHLEVYREALKR